MMTFARHHDVIIDNYIRKRPSRRQVCADIVDIEHVAKNVSKTLLIAISIAHVGVEILSSTLNVQMSKPFPENAREDPTDAFGADQDQNLPPVESRDASVGLPSPEYYLEEQVPGLT